jgi:hypothetical protein
MWKRIKRVWAGIISVCLFIVLLLTADIPKKLEQADKSFVTIAKNLGVQNPPIHAVSIAWSYPFAVLLTIFAVFLVSVFISWGIEKVYICWKKKSIEENSDPVIIKEYAKDHSVNSQISTDSVRTLHVQCVEVGAIANTINERIDVWIVSAWESGIGLGHLCNPNTPEIFTALNTPNACYEKCTVINEGPDTLTDVAIEFNIEAKERIKLEDKETRFC